MSTIERDIARLGDDLQARWRADLSRTRTRRRAGIAGSSGGAILALAATAIAAGVLPFHLSSSSSRPSAAAVAAMREFTPHSPNVAWHLDAQDAHVIGTLTGSGVGRLSVVVATERRRSRVVIMRVDSPRA